MVEHQQWIVAHLLDLQGRQQQKGMRLTHVATAQLTQLRRRGPYMPIAGVAVPLKVAQLGQVLR